MLEEIIEVVENVTNIKLIKKTRERPYIMARALYYHFARHITNNTLDVIGKTLNKDHATVVFSLKNFDSYYKFDDYFKKHHKKINDILKEKFKDVDFDFYRETEANKIIHLNKIIKKLRKQIDEEKTYIPKQSESIDDMVSHIPFDRVESFKKNQLKSFILMENSRINYSDIKPKKQKKEIIVIMPN